jgi:Lrp/AsnC family transcriptional regulator, regulator for asnA, asnC and gidA
VARPLDALDKHLVGLLGDDGRLSLAEASGRAGVSRPTVAARLKSLAADGVLRVAGLIDPFRLSGLTTALVGLTVDKHRLDEKVEQIAALPDVTWAAVVTGRYDIMAEVVTTSGMSGLYDFLNISLRQVGGINSSEVFVVMKARNKWMLLPRSLRQTWATAGGEGRGDIE